MAIELQKAKEWLSKAKKEKPFLRYNPKKNSKDGGLNDKYREKYNREHGSNLKRPVTGKVKEGSKASKRRKSFCARMSGVSGPTSKEGKLTPKGAALKRWKCGNMKKGETMKTAREKLVGWLEKGILDGVKSLGKQTPTTSKMYHMGHAAFHEKQAKVHSIMGNHKKADFHVKHQMKHLGMADKYQGMIKEGKTKL